MCPTKFRQIFLTEDAAGLVYCQQISCFDILWEDEETERYYLFLPSCFAGKNTEFTLWYESGKGTVEIMANKKTRRTLWLYADERFP